MKKVIGLVVSVDYSDFLSISLPSFKAATDAVFVCTKTGDSAFDLAKSLDCSVMEYSGFHARDAKFNKSGAICAAQEYLHENYPDAWIVLADADIVLPPTLRASIEDECNDEQAMYSLTRLDFHTPQEYAEKRGRYYAFPFSGYCQIYYRKDVCYPAWSASASHCDCFFRDQFKTWIRLPGVAEHLGCDHVNWNGRKSPEWTLQPQ